MAVRAVVLVALLSVMTAAARVADPLGLEILDEAVPPLSLRGKGSATSLDNAALAGQVVLLHFWATWCTPCKAELPALQHLASALPPNTLKIVLVAIDTNAGTDEVARFARDLGIDLPLYLARDSTVSASFWGWGVPASYLLDAQGRFIGRMRGPRHWDDPVVIEYLAGLSHS